jgi:hypothetical protein
MAAYIAASTRFTLPGWFTFSTPTVAERRTVISTSSGRRSAPAVPQRSNDCPVISSDTVQSRLAASRSSA